MKPISVMGRSVVLMALLAVGLVGVGGCAYENVRFRPTDVQSQRTIAGVSVERKRGPVTDVLGTTNEHGQLDTYQLKSRDVLIFSAPGYGLTLITLGDDSYTVRIPDGKTFKLDLRSGDAVPVPMHRK